MKLRKTRNILAALGILIVIMIPLMSESRAQEGGVLIYGTFGRSMVDTIDPHDAWDSKSIAVLDQVLEGLFAYDLTDPDLTIINRLATGFVWSAGSMNLTIFLREGVTFHDGTTFGAEDVIFSFDRLQTLMENDLAQVAELYEPLYQQPVINSTHYIERHIVKFELNYVYSAFIPLLCFSASYIIPENSQPLDDLVSYGNGDQIIGTGPFIYDADDVFDANELDFIAYDGYWQAAPSIQKMVWVLYPDANVVNQAFLNGDMDIPEAALPEFYDQYENDEYIVLGGVLPNLVVTYLGLSCINLDLWERKAVSYAIDYDYLIDEILLGYARRLKSPVPQGISDAIEPNVATLDLEVARTAMSDHINWTYYTEEFFGFTPAEIAAGSTFNVSSPDSMWQEIANGDPILTYNYTYNLGSSTRFDFGIAIGKDLTKIGVQMAMTGVTWSQFLRKAFVANEELELYLLGRFPDYNDASNYINPLFSNTSSANSVGLNDPAIQTGMIDALTTSEPIERATIYAEIQTRLVEELYPWAFISTGAGRDAWATSVSGIQHNAMGKTYFYPIQFDDSKRQPFSYMRGESPEEMALLFLFWMLVIIGICVLCAKNFKVPSSDSKIPRNHGNTGHAVPVKKSNLEVPKPHNLVNPSLSIVHCSQCGEKNMLQGKFCIHCGEKLE